MTQRRYAPDVVKTVRTVVREIVSSEAPEELPLLDGLLRLDDVDVTRALSPRPQRNDPLGFGLAEVTATVTPIVWFVVDEAARQAVGTVVDTVSVRAGAVIRRVLRRPAREPQVVPRLTAEQLQKVHERLRMRAAEAGLDGPDVERLADAVVSSLARD